MDHPTDKDGRYICDRANPMPVSRDQMGQRWIHLEAKEASSTDYTITYQCAVCGIRWSVEIPE